MTLFEQLFSHVDELLELGKNQNDSGSTKNAESIFRACLIMTVSALDTYMHEKCVESFQNTLQAGHVQSISTYLSIPSMNASDPNVTSLIRYRLSFKTLVTPDSIDKAITASGEDPGEIWRNIGIDKGSRESRLRTTLDMFVDRRNAISHEGDWDPIQLSMRHISESHVKDCQDCISFVALGLDKHWL